MKTLEVTFSIAFQVPDTGDKTYDCMVALDAVKKFLNGKPSYELLRAVQSVYGGDPLVQITKLKRSSKSWIDDSGDSQPPPFNIEVPIEEDDTRRRA
jgi:hypothetical protein